MGEILTPSFKRPPVVETALGVQFMPLAKWSIPYYGLYWDKMRRQFPKTEIQPPLASASEIAPGGVRVQVMDAPEVRCWYLAENGSELVQVQDNRFVVNWRQTSDAHVYPRYIQAVRPLFEAQWKSFKAFLASENLSSPTVVNCEITYVNHIIKGEGWQTAADWDEVFSVCGNIGGGDKFLPAPEARQFAFNYPMPDAMGTLDVVAVRAIRQRDGKDVVQFSLSAKGHPRDSNEDSILDWFDRGHEWVVKGFTELTTPKMHELWGRSQ
jgi:uncharacterized protein (TIGR04255 family)